MIPGMSGLGFKPKSVNSFLITNLSTLYSSTLSEMNNLVDFKFDDTGTKLMTLGWDTSDVPTLFQYTLSTAWNLSTRTLSGSKDISSMTSNPKSFCYSSTGTYCYIASYSGGMYSINEIIPSVAWGIQYSSYTSSNADSSVSHSGIALSTDGTKLISCGNSNNVYKYPLTTAFSITGVSAPNQFYNFSHNSNSIHFNSDGTKLFNLEVTTGILYYYSVPSAFNVTSIGLVGSKTLSFPAYKFVFSPDGSKAFATYTNVIYQLAV